MQTKKKILFISSILGGGGAERIMVYLMNHLVRKANIEIILLLISDKEHSYLQHVDKRVRVIKLNFKKRIRYSFVEVYKAIKKIKPNIVYIGLDSLNLLFSFFIPILNRNKIKFVVRETNVLSVKYGIIKYFLIPFYYLFYNKYDRIIVQSDDMERDLYENFKIKGEKLHKINNPVDVEKINILSESESVDLKKGCFNFIAIGRLTRQKGYDILLKRLSENRTQNFHLTILGKGELKDEIERQIVEFDLTDKIDIIDFTPNPYKYIKVADAIILSSRHEGFPNVLLEANSLGKPILSNICLGGINEIVINGRNGLAFDFHNKLLFQQKFNEFMNTEFNKCEILELTKARYDIHKIMPKFEDIFNSLL